MANERSYVARGHAKANGGIDEIGEKGYAVFEIIVCNLHDAGGELDDGYARSLFHFAGRIEETVFGDTGIRIDDQDIVANTARCQISESENYKVQIGVEMMSRDLSSVKRTPKGANGAPRIKLTYCHQPMHGGFSRELLSGSVHTQHTHRCESSLLGDRFLAALLRRH